ncbi:MAG TPA: diguanylate cyclase [Spirochaetes bacterium]|nr:diguanylate cyclase [Spirochaetota bacterium]
MDKELKNNCSNSVRMLLIVDRPANAPAVEIMLKSAVPESFEILTVSGVTAGVEALAAGNIEVGILYASLNDEITLKKFRRLRDRAPEMPLLALTDSMNEGSAIQMIKEGAEDVLLKEHFNRETVTSAVCFAIERKRLKESLRKTTEDLKRSVNDLKRANKKIIERQKSVIEEERLKVILMMAGATAHEIKQPLTAILGNIELMKMFEKIPPELERYISEIKGAGNKINEIVSSVHEVYDGENSAHVRDLPPVRFDRQINILSVEDSDQDFETIQISLSDHEGIRLKRALNFIEALNILKKDCIDVVLMDYLLPDGNGLDFMKNIRTTGNDVPVIVVTGQGDEIIASRFIKEGAFDYFPKNRLSERSLSRSIANTLEKARLKKEVVHAQRRLADLSIKDELTQLYNRRFFMETLEREIARAGRFKTELVLCMMDLDHFKNVNDTYGHPAGDFVLARVGKMLGKCIRLGDYSGRYGGEEFAVLLPNTSLEKARAVCERFREMVAGYRFKFHSHDIRLTISIGVANFKGFSDQSAEGMVAVADNALYKAKHLGRNRVNKAAVK